MVEPVGSGGDIDDQWYVQLHGFLHAVFQLWYEGADVFLWTFQHQFVVNLQQQAGIAGVFQQQLIDVEHGLFDEVCG